MKTRNHNLKAAAFILAAAVIISVFPQFAAAETVGAPKNLMLSLTGDNEEMAVTWWNDESETTGKVRYGTEAALTHCSTISAAWVYGGSGYSVFEGIMTGLFPDTVYYYQVENSKEISPVKSFKTPENNLQSYSFLYLGDVQVSETDMQSAVDSYSAWGKLVKAAKQRNPDLLFGLQGGDLVSNGTRMEEWNAIFENACPVFSEIPLMPTNGNHESNFLSGKPELYLKLFALPQNGPDGFQEEFYSFDYGSSHIAVLNSWVFSGEQKLNTEDYAALKTWIVKDLENSSATWKIVVTHLPVYAVHSDVNADAVRKSWAPIFEQCGADLVFVGHQHVYARSFPMYQGSIDYEKGVTYIMGNSGPKFYSSADERYSEKTIYNTSTYQIIHIEGDTLEVVTFDIDGNELDYWSASAKMRTGLRESMESGVSGASGESRTFADVPQGAWYEEAVKYNAEKGLMGGTSSALFSPGATLTRSMFATVLYRMAGEPEGSRPEETLSVGFQDVPSGTWYSDAVAWASEKRIINGYGNDRFGPADTVTREQLAAMLYRYASSINYDTADKNDLSGFQDTAQISDWSVPALRWAVDAGLINGRKTGILDPSGAATRAECSALLMKFDSKYSNKI